MDADLLIQTLNFIAPLSSKIQARLHEYLIEEKYPKRHLLVHEGHVANRIYFITEGFARAYFYHDAKECTTWFMGKGDFMISVFSFFTQQPAVENIELLEDTVLISMTWTQLQNIYADFVEFNYVGRLITEKYYMMSEERAILHRTISALERYKIMIKKYPQIMQKVKLGQIASYLGISPETLSRVRGNKGILT
jgi:CRP-like cAMP-binding protein